MRRTTDPSPEHPESPASRIPTNTPDATAKPTSATPLNARGQLTLLTAQVSDALASSIQAIAMPLLTYGATGDLAHSAIVMVVEAVPVILFAPFAGAIADKFNRKTLTVSFRLASAALLIASPALYAAAGLPAFLTIAFLVSTFGTFSSPAASAAMPSLLGDDYQKYMARRGSLIFLAQTLGPTIAAAVASFTTPALAVGFAGTLNLLAALTVATIRNYDLTHAERTATVQEHHTGRLLREGAAYTAHNPIVRGMLTFWFLSIAAVPITTLPMLEYLTRGLGHDYTAFGIATSVYAAGCVISSWLALVHLGHVLRTRRSARASPLRRRYRRTHARARLQLHGCGFLPSGYGRVPHHRMGGTSVRRDQHHCYRRGTLHHRHRIHVHSRPDCASDTGAGIAE